MSYKQITGILLTLLLCATAWPQAAPRQVDVSVKIVEFQASKGVETGLSAYFKERGELDQQGVVIGPGNRLITTGDVTFPSTTTAGLTVFLDRLVSNYGNFEVVLQGLVDQNRAFILSRPRAVVPVGADEAGTAWPPTIIKTTQDVGFESTMVVGSTAHQVTEFKPTGVTLQVNALQVIDDDGNFSTEEDTYIELQLTATVSEEGQRVVVALDDLLAGTGGIFDNNSNAITVPEFVERSMTTRVWVRNGQTLILGGLYRNQDSKTLNTLPWLAQGEDIANNVVQRILPFSAPGLPLSSSLGNQNTSRERRELVFLIKVENWKRTFTIADDFGFEGADGIEDKKPTDVITGVIEDIADIPQGVVKGITGGSKSSGVTKQLGSDDG